ncbi:hypothetical protein ACFUN8_09085 [Streptomyces sp. NPDC057307]|uniref:hypothetical protein n=1 Tax=Streptomyces sp. NPDC057307 TaxID=3346096 RepID=UPI0036294572
MPLLPGSAGLALDAGGEGRMVARGTGGRAMTPPFDTRTMVVTGMAIGTLAVVLLTQVAKTPVS